MLYPITNKFKEVFLAVLPITVIVTILNFTVAPLGMPLFIRFLLGAFFIVIGLSIFLFGVDVGITPVGNLMGSIITKSNKIWIVGISGLVLGFFVSVAEPDLQILASQVEFVSSGLIPRLSIVVVVSLGIAVLLTAGLIRIVYNVPLYKVLTALYGLIFILSLFTSSEFLAISFDASGATTGALTVPFILALGFGVAVLKKDSKSSEKDSFGLVAIASTGAIISVMIMSIIKKTDKITASLEVNLSETSSIMGPFLQKLPHVLFEVFIALLPLLVIFLVFQVISFKLDKRAFFKILKGFVYTYIGLVYFMVGVNASFMDVGSKVGYYLAGMDNKIYIVLVGFLLGFVTILAEPAVYVLTDQIEEVTSGYVKRSIIMTALSIGVGFSVALSVIRIMIPGIQLWHYLLPGYLISVIMTFFVPKLFVGIAFDSGGVASGPMTATFILAFAQGAAERIESANVLIDGFGIIAMVALTPLITLQIVGFIYKIKSKKGGLKVHAK